MMAALVQARHSLRRSRALLLVMLGVLVVFEVALVAAAGTLHESGAFSSFAALVPSFMREMFGESLLVLLSFTGVVALGYFHPVIIAALAALTIAIATEPVGEIETRFLDAVLARPVRRAAVLGRSALLLALVPAFVIAVMLAATWLGLRLLAPYGVAVPALLILSLGANLWALLLCLGGVALAVGAAARRRSTAAGLVGVVALALFLVEYVARIWKPAVSMARLSPFHYYDAMAMVMGRPLPAVHVEVLLFVAVSGGAVAFVLFSRRDL
jgi:ABC-2 type transport system permease protein